MALAVLQSRSEPAHGVFNMMQGSLLHRCVFSAIAASLLWAIGCAGVGDADVAPTDATPSERAQGDKPALTYADLVAQHGGAEAWPDAGGSDEQVPAQTVTVTVDAKVVTAATCHPGELDLAEKLIADSETAARLTLTLEGEAGELFGSLPLDHGDLLNTTRRLYNGHTASFIRSIELTLPAPASKTRDFDANLFVCVDSNGNGLCSDESVDEIGGLSHLVAGGNTKQEGAEDAATASASFVLGYIPLAGLLSDTGVEFVRRTVGASGEDAARPPEQMQTLLKNYDAADFGVAADSTTITLAALTAPGCDYAIQTEPPAPRTDGCFVAGTRISVGTGKQQRVEELWGGTEVMTRSGAVVPVLRAVVGPEREPVVALETHGGHALVVTKTHPMMTVDGLKTARDLTLGDRMLTASGEPVGIQSLTSLPYGGMVYNFEIAGASANDHLVVAEGLLVGDLFLQEQLTASDKVAVSGP